MADDSIGRLINAHMQERARVKTLSVGACSKDIRAAFSW